MPSPSPLRRRARRGDRWLPSDRPVARVSAGLTAGLIAGLIAGIPSLGLVLLLAGTIACAPHPEPAPPAPKSVAVIRPKIALALGGGGARGFAHVGALRVLEQEKIPVDFVVGTSVGSLVGALYADQGRVLDAELTALQVEEEDLFDYRAFAIFSGGLIKGQKLEKFLTTHLHHQNIESMAIPYAAVATDLETGATFVFRQGPVASAVHASCAIPGAFIPVEVGERTYVDGGVTNPVPVSVARELGADLVIAMSIPPPVRKPPAKNPVAVAYHCAAIMAAEIGRLRAGEADILIETRADSVDFDDFSQKRKLIELGEQAARAALPAIRAAIAARTREVGATSAIEYHRGSSPAAR